jgi:Subtilase family/Secretion system C-terminal sorting domain
MKKLLFIFLLSFGVFQLHSQVQLISNKLPLYENTRIYLKIKDTSSIVLKYPIGNSTQTTKPNSIYSIFSLYKVTLVETPFAIMGTPSLKKIYRITFNSFYKADDLINDLKPFSFIEYAEKVPTMYTCTTVPNDPFSTNTAQDPLALSKAYDAFDIFQGGSRIAIVDDAVLTTHEDLQSNIFLQRDVADNDNNANPPLSGVNATNNNIFSHGTHVSGIAGAVTNNGIGKSSIGWQNRIIAIKAVSDNSTNTGVITNGFDGVAWAAANQAQVINLSWGGPAFANAEYTVIQAARNQGIIIVCAAGNDSSSGALYPAAYGEGTTGEIWELPNKRLVIAVSSIDANGQRSNWGTSFFGPSGSNFGQWVDISAYGTQILSTVAQSNNGKPVNNNYGSKNGTSMAAPLVSSLVGLMLSYNNSTPDQVINCLLSTANPDIYQVQGNISGTLGSGRLDAYEALKCLTTNCTALVNNTKAFIYANQSSICPKANATLSANQGIAYQWSTGATAQSININLPGVYSVTVTFSGGCTSVANIKIAPQNPNAQLFINENSGNLPNDGLLCNQDPLRLSCSWGLNYSWSAFGANSQQIPGYINAGSQIPFYWDFSVTITGVNGCVGVNEVLKGKASWLPSPNATLNVVEDSQIPNDGIICDGNSAKISTPSATGGLTLTYLWNTGETTSSISVTPNSTATYTVTITNVNGCSSVGTTKITVIPQISFPSISIMENSQIPNDGIICAGTPVTLSVPLITGQKYLWSTGQSINSIIVSPLVTTTFNLTVTNSNGCSIVKNVIITVNPGSSADFTFSIKCPNIELTPISIGGSHLWTLTNSQGVQIATNNTVTSSFANVANGIYSIKHTVTNNCGSISTVKDVTVDCATSNLVCPCTNSKGSIGAKNTITYLSQTTFYKDPKNANGFTPPNNGCITISGQLNIDVSYNFTGAEIIMQPEAEIVVLANNDLELFSNYIHGCTQLWKSIKVEPGAFIHATNNTIEDAQYAFYLRHTAVGNIAHNTFNKDYIGVRYDAAPIPPNYINVTLSANVFKCDATLLPRYDGVNLGLRTLFGIQSQFATFVAGTFLNTATSNEFRGIRNGVTMYKTYALLNTFNIHDLIPDNPIPITALTTSYNIDGVGILSNISTLGVYDATFNNIDVGISMSGNTSIVETFRSLYNTRLLGVDILNGNSGDFVIQSNNIFSYGQRGIRFFNTYNPLNLRIDGANRFANTGLGGAAAIEANSPVSSTILNSKFIEHNLFQLSTTSDGISFNKDSRFEINKNDIQYETDNLDDYRGIYLSNSPNNRLWGNNIIGKLSNGAQTLLGTAIYGNMSAGNNFCCNTTNNTLEGIYFTSSNTNNHLVGTNIGSHYRGLTMSSSAVIGVQSLTSNQWCKSSYGEYAARHDAGIQNIINISQSRFDIFGTQGTSLNNCYVWHNQVETGDPVWASSWFVPKLGSLQPCNSYVDFCGTEPLKPTGGGDLNIPELTLSIANGKFYKSKFGEHIQWEGGRHILREIDEHPEWITGNDIIAKYAKENEYSNLRRFNNIDDLFGQLNTASEQQKEVLQNHKAQIKEIEIKFNALEIVLLKAKNKKDTAVLMQERGKLLNQIGIHSYEMNQISDAILKNNASILDEAIEINENIIAENVFEKNEVIINRIYLNTVAIGKYDLDKEQRSIVSLMAEKCPIYAGSAVFRARALAALFSNERYEDKILCKGEIVIDTKPLSKILHNEETSIAIYPNPTQGILSIDIPKLTKVDRLVIKEVSGRIIHQSEINSNSFQIDLKNINNGIYYCEFLFNQKPISTNKIVIIH